MALTDDDVVVRRVDRGYLHLDLPCDKSKPFASGCSVPQWIRTVRMHSTEADANTDADPRKRIAVSFWREKGA